jgi:hypothetical protein
LARLADKRSLEHHRTRARFGVSMLRRRRSIVIVMAAASYGLDL